MPKDKIKTTVQLWVLMECARRSKVNTHNLVKVAGKSAQSLSGTTDLLAANGLINKIKVGHVMHYSITQEGRNALHEFYLKFKSLT